MTRFVLPDRGGCASDGLRMALDEINAELKQLRNAGMAEGWLFYVEAAKKRVYEQYVKQRKEERQR